jgi:hypothetical protein
MGENKTGEATNRGQRAMSKVVQFPGSRNLPPAPTVDALIGELAAVEIELARARLAQIRSETRQAQALWGWQCFKRALFCGLVLWLLSFAVPAKAQNQTTFRDSRGSTTGTATRSGNTVTFRDSRGSTTGTATRSSNGTTTFRDAGGRTTGTASGPRR